MDITVTVLVVQDAWMVIVTYQMDHVTVEVDIMALNVKQVSATYDTTYITPPHVTIEVDIMVLNLKQVIATY